MSRKRGRKPAEPWTRQRRINDLLGRAVLASETKREIADDWGVSMPYFEGIWRDAKTSLSKRRSGVALASTRATDYKVTLGASVLDGYLDDREKAIETERHSVAFQAHQVNDPHVSARAEKVLGVSPQAIRSQPDAVLEDSELLA